MLTPLHPHQSGKILANSLNLYYETFGDPENPAVLLIMGVSCPCLQWFPYFIDPIVQQGYYVIRFDNRDVGLSNWIDAPDWQKSPYSLEDMAQDAVELLADLYIDKAHIIGASMGGAIAQQIAINYPTRALTLTSLISFGDAAALTADEGFLPSAGKIPDLNEYLAFWASLTGSAFPFDRDLFTELYREHVVTRKGYNPDCTQHQLTAIGLSGSRMTDLKKLILSTLIANGDEDPLVPYSHSVDYVN
jgi:pimeloyl-ACP methyl ester carboxylesterase